MRIGRRRPSKQQRLSEGRALAAGLAGGIVLGRGMGGEKALFGKQTGWSIAGPDAAGWITDFINAAYYRRKPEARDVDDLRLAVAIVTTQWWRRGGRRLRMTDVLPFHRTFGKLRLTGGVRSPRGTLNREELLNGAIRLFGDWFPDAYEDDARRGWSVVFETAEEKKAYDPEKRADLNRFEDVSPPEASGEEQGWHTYSPVEIQSANRVIDALARTETWPDFASEVGRFTALRESPLLGQTFEIDVAAGTTRGRPVFKRGYVTITRLVNRDDPDELREYFDELAEGLLRYGDNEPRAMPEGGEPIFGIDLTTHKGHFMGRGRNRLILYSHEGQDYIRAAGTWDPMQWHVRTTYNLAGRDAQHAFWGRGGSPDQSMLHQIAERVG